MSARVPMSVRLHAAFVRLFAPGLARRHGDSIGGTLADLHAEARASGRLFSVPRLVVREMAQLIGQSLAALAADLGRGLGADFRMAARSLRKRPFVTAVMVLTMAIGIASVTTVFRAVQQMLLEPLPFEAPDELVMLWEYHEESGPQAFSLATPASVDAWRTRSSTLADLGASRNATRSLTGLERPQSPLTTLVTPNLFDLLGVAPALGRGFTAQDATPGADPTVLLSHELWQQLGGDADLVGGTLELDGRDATVLGVMPQGFRFPTGNNPTVIWAPLQIVEWSDRSSQDLFVFGRLAAGVDSVAVGDELDAIAAGLAMEFPDTHAGRRVRVDSLPEWAAGQARTPLLALMGAVTFVLLIACVNVANLQLARALGRTDEMALRLALGARRVRVLRQLLVEALAVGMLGGGLGLVAALWTTPLVDRFMPEWARSEFYSTGTLNASVLLFTTAATVVTAIVFGSLPALALARRAGAVGLGSHRSTEGSGGRRARRGLAVAEVAISLMLLTGAGLMVRSLMALEALDPGIDPNHVTVMRTGVRGPAYATPESQAAFFTTVVERLEALPGVERAAAATRMPPTGASRTTAFVQEGAPPVEPGREPRINQRAITPGYFETLGVEVLAGTPFGDGDWGEGEPVAVINDVARDRFWAGVAPVGRMVTLLDDRVPRRIVAVVRSARTFGVPPDPMPVIFVPHEQAPFRTMTVAIRTRPGAGSLMHEAEETILGVEPSAPVYNMALLTERLDRANMAVAATAQLLGGFAALALVLVAVGIYGVMSQGVSERVREFGIRMALGARAGGVMWLILADAVRIVAWGAALGLVGAMALSRMLRGLLFGVGSADPVTFAAVASSLLAIVLAVSWIPGIRAMRADPATTLREG